MLSLLNYFLLCESNPAPFYKKVRDCDALKNQYNEWNMVPLEVAPKGRDLNGVTKN